MFSIGLGQILGRRLKWTDKNLSSLENDKSQLLKWESIADFFH